MKAFRLSIYFIIKTNTMFNSFKKSLGYLPDSSIILTSFSFCSKFEVKDKQIVIKNSAANQASLIHKVFRMGEELEIHFHENNRRNCYYITKEPYFNSANDKIFEVEDKKHKGSKLIMILESQKRTLQVFDSDNFGNGLIFSTTNLAIPIGGKAGLIKVIDIHFKNWVEENKFLLELGTEIDDFVTLWQIVVEKEIPNFINQFGFDNEHIKRTIRHYTQIFLIEASDKLK